MDTLGIILCGALKNVYAIGAGLYGESDSSAASMPYLESAISEMQQILKANRADPETLRLSCGAADLVLSCAEGSRNFRFGFVLLCQGLFLYHNQCLFGFSLVLNVLCRKGGHLESGNQMRGYEQFGLIDL